MRGTVIHKLRQSELREISITEILFILIFSLLVFIHYAERENLDAVQLKDKKIQSLEQKLKIEKRKFENLSAKNRTLSADLQHLRERYRALATVILKHISITGTLTPQEVDEALEELKFIANNASRGKEPLVDEIRRLNDKIRRLNDEIRRLKDRIKELEPVQSKSGDGMDNPRCLVPGTTLPIQYLYEATMHPAQIELRAMWPEFEDRLYLAVPGIGAFSHGGIFANAEFDRQALRIYNWSVAQKPACRFVVKLRDRTGNSKSVYSAQLRRVERFFYKTPVK